MGVVLAMAVGYVLGARAGRGELDDVNASLRAVWNSDEFADLVAALRNQTAHVLREAASMVEATPRTDDDGLARGDLVEQVRSMFSR
jgi:hypothetical protein